MREPQPDRGHRHPLKLLALFCVFALVLGAAAPTITDISPDSQEITRPLVVTGTDFVAGMTLWFHVDPAAPNAWVSSYPGQTVVSSDGTTMGTSVPILVPFGPVQVVVGTDPTQAGAVFSEEETLTVDRPLFGPIVESVTPSRGPAGTQLTVNGAGFGAAAGSSANVDFYDPLTIPLGPVATVVVSGASVTPTRILVTLPSLTLMSPATPAIISVSTMASGTYPGGRSPASYSSQFLVRACTITGMTASARVGGLVTLTGTLFEPVPVAGVRLLVGGIARGTTGWSDTRIKFTVPASAYGKVAVSLVRYGVPVAAPVKLKVVPRITRISPASGRVGTIVTIYGTGFGPTRARAAGSVHFGARTPSYLSWSQTKIRVKVPTGTARGWVHLTITTAGGTSAVVHFKRL
jgi:hypothetical protein